MRIGLSFLILAAAISVMIFLLPGLNPQFVGKTKASILDTDEQVLMYGNDNSKDSSYYVTFLASPNSTSESGFILQQEVSSDFYSLCRAREAESREYSYNLYRTPQGASENSFYISNKSGFFLRLEYHRYYMSQNVGKLTAAIFVLTGMAVVCFSVGMSQIRLSMKYPRTDVRVEKNEIVLSGQGDLMEEFHEAQRRNSIRKNLGLSADEPIPKEYLENDNTTD